MGQKKDLNIQTQAIHAGEKKHQLLGSAVAPIFQSATYASLENNDSYGDVRYHRLNNCPNHDLLHIKLAQLENAEAALVSSSGMAAITNTFLGLLSEGHEVLVQKELYGGTFSFLKRHAPRMGIQAKVIDLDHPETWKAQLTNKTKMIYVESIANPLMKVGPFDEVVTFAQQNELISVVDNTFATPFNFQPIAMGFDLSLHSATKYLNGHSDLIAGAAMGKKQYIEKIKDFQNYSGSCLDPHALFLLNRGLKTFPVRMRIHNENAMSIAKYLSEHSKVKQVYYPGLNLENENKSAKKFFKAYGGMLAFEVHGDVEGFVSQLDLAMNAPSLGGVESLVTIPAQTSHVGLTQQERREMGVSDSLIRFSVGIENVEDLKEDLNQALEKI